MSVFKVFEFFQLVSAAFCILMRHTHIISRCSPLPVSINTPKLVRRTSLKSFVHCHRRNHEMSWYDAFDWFMYGTESLSVVCTPPCIFNKKCAIVAEYHIRSHNYVSRAGSRPMQSMQMHRSEKNDRCIHRSDFYRKIWETTVFAKAQGL